MNNNSGIYLIKNNINNKVYVGSAANITTRWNSHKSALNSQKHKNIHLQRAWNKYGATNFCFSVIELCDKKELIIKEQTQINKLKSANSLYGYNIAPIAMSSLGIKRRP